MKKRAVRPRYGDLFADWELAVANAVVAKFWTSNRSLRAVYEQEDLLQECLIQWHRARNQYVVARGASPKTYLRKVTENKLLGLIRYHEAELRRVNCEAILFSAPVMGDGGRESTIGEQVDEVGSNGSEGPVTEGRVIHEALESVLGELTPRQRAIVDLLADDLPKTEIAAKVGIHRDTLYRDVERIRKLFEDKGLRKFLQ